MKPASEIFTVKRALIWHTIFFSFGLLQKEFDLSLLWFIMNCFVMFLLLQVVYKENNNWELLAWYFYFLSFFTDLLSISVYGGDLQNGENNGTHKSAQRFILSMSIFLMLGKPFFIYGIAKKLKSEGVNLKSGLKNPKQSLASLDYANVTNPGQNDDYINNNINNNQMNVNNNNNLDDKYNNNYDYNYNPNISQPQYPQQGNNNNNNNNDGPVNVTGTIGQPVQDEYANFQPDENV